MQVVEKLVHNIRSTAKYNPEVQVPPACILWPDRDRQWEAVTPRLQSELPELFILGDYNPAHRTGPAIWLRCVLAGKISGYELPNATPIFYLPGVSRQDLRAVEACPDYLKPLAELQYRGAMWSQHNAKDWTIFAFLKSNQGGLGLDAASDNDSKNAMQLALYQMLDEEIELLSNKRLDKDYFNTLLTGGDPVRDLLQWLDHADSFRSNRGDNEWRAFVEVSKSQFAFDPENQGILAGAAKLAAHEGPWNPVWERFCEAPKRYLNIPARIRATAVPMDLFTDKSGWPQWNEAEEELLRQELLTLDRVAPHEGRKKLIDLEKRHGTRRQLVWSELDEAPLAAAMEHLKILAEITTNALVSGNMDDIIAAYSNSGYQADDAVLQVLACVNKQEDVDAITKTIRSIYLPWMEDSARYLQKLVLQSGYPGSTVLTQQASIRKEGECILFVDGLRFDVGRKLAELLTNRGFQPEERLVWAALPSVTSTGKPAVSPVNGQIFGEQVNVDFEPYVADTGQSLKGGYHFKKLLTDEGWQVLMKSSMETGDGIGSAWCEFGNIDHEGHDRGWKIAKHLDSLLLEICNRVEELLEVGWKSIRIVTDHGWLMVPGGLPKSNLPAVLTENKWGRCSIIKEGAVTEERLYPWYWNPEKNFALAEGISCYRVGEEYAHGGLSLQECLTLELTVSAYDTGQGSTTFEFTDITWKGLRCTVAVEGEFTGLSLDIRTQAGNPSSSTVVSVKPIKSNGTASVVVEDEELTGTSATLVLLHENGELVYQVMTLIGGDDR